MSCLMKHRTVHMLEVQSVTTCGQLLYLRCGGAEINPQLCVLVDSGASRGDDHTDNS
jgi:hypothetical protein